MTYNPNANWTARATARHQTPVYFLKVDGITTFRYSTGPVRGATTTYKEYMQTPRGATQQIKPLEGRASLGTLSITITDVGEDVTNTLAPGQVVPTWINRKVELFAGYTDLDESDYAAIYVGQVVDWDARDVEYTLKIRDFRRSTIEQIMTNSTETDTTRIRGNPLNLWYAIITGDFANVSFPVTWGGATPTGLDIDASLVDTTHLANERDTWLFDTEYLFAFSEPIKAKNFFEEQIFKLLGYPIIRPDGSLSVRLYHPAHPGEATVDLGEDDIIGQPSISANFDDHINHVKIYGDHDPDADPEFTLLYELLDSADVTATGETALLEVQSEGLRTALKGERNARFAGNKIFQRYIVPPLSVKVDTLFSKRVYEVGEVINVTHGDLFNEETGTRGWTDVPCEILKAEPDFVRGRMRLTLLTTAFGNRYRVIAPNTLGDYTTQTDAEKAKWLSVSGTSPDEFSNGDPAHEVI